MMAVLTPTDMSARVPAFRHACEGRWGGQGFCPAHRNDRSVFPGGRRFRSCPPLGTGAL